MNQLQYYESKLRQIKIDSSLELILSGYLAHLKEDIQTAVECIQVKDLECLHLLSHKVYGTAESFGLKEIGDVFKDLVHLHEELDDDTLIDLMLKLNACVESLQSELTFKDIT